MGNTKPGSYYGNPKSRGSAVGIATGYGLDNRDHIVQTDPGVRPTSYPMRTGGSFPGGKAAGV
jgi:hypothetical protein